MAAAPGLGFALNELPHLGGADSLANRFAVPLSELLPAQDLLYAVASNMLWND